MGNIVKATILGQVIDLHFNETTGKYEAEYNAPADSSYQYNAGHYFPVSISATDEANNTTTISDTEGNFKENLKLYVREQIKPKITDISPSDNAYIGTSNPKIEFTVLDNANGQESGFSGINPDSITLVINGDYITSELITKESVDGGYRCSYTPSVAIPDGDCTITITANDFDGNASGSTSVVFTVDTKPPVLNIISPDKDGLYTNQAKFNVVGITSDANSSPVTVEIKVNDVSQGFVDISQDGSFSKEVLLTKEGVNTITITSTDKAEKESSVTRTIILKTSGPIFKEVIIAPGGSKDDPVNCGNSYTITVTFDE